MKEEFAPLGSIFPFPTCPISVQTRLPFSIWSRLFFFVFYDTVPTESFTPLLTKGPCPFRAMLAPFDPTIFSPCRPNYQAISTHSRQPPHQDNFREFSGYRQPVPSPPHMRTYVRNRAHDSLLAWSPSTVFFFFYQWIGLLINSYRVQNRSNTRAVPDFRLGCDTRSYCSSGTNLGE